MNVREIEIYSTYIRYTYIYIYIYIENCECQMSKEEPLQSVFCTRSCADLRAADLDWIVRPGYSLGRVHSGEKP